MRWLAALMLLVVLATSSLFYQQFYIPKLIAFYTMSVVAVFQLSLRRQLKLPESSAMFFMAGLALVGMIWGMDSSAPETGFMLWAYYLSASMVFLALQQLNAEEISSLLKVVLVTALLQLPVILFQMANSSSMLVNGSSHIPGTIGNPEFLSTWLGVAFFIGLHFHEDAETQGLRIGLLLACTALLFGLLMAQNKGGLLFIGLYFLWKRYPSRLLIVGIMLAMLLLGIFLFPDSIKGRLLLWSVAELMIVQHWLAGVGFVQFENHYLDVVHKIFTTYPEISDRLGAHTAMTMDAHNIILQFGAELGLAGLILAVLFSRYLWKVANTNPGNLGAALLFLLYKCMYTVVLTSITSMIALLVLLAALTNKRAIEVSVHGSLALKGSGVLLILLLMFSTVLTLPDYYYQRGLHLLLMGDNSSAVVEMERALSINKEYASANLALAQVSYQRQDYEKMKGYLSDALHYRKNKDTCKIAASMYFYSRHYEDAFNLYQFLHVTFPQHLTSLTKLASIYMLRGDYRQANLMAQKALQTVPRKEAASDEKNLRIARRIVSDSATRLSLSNGKGSQ